MKNKKIKSWFFIKETFARPAFFLTTTLFLIIYSFPSSQHLKWKSQKTVEGRKMSKGEKWYTARNFSVRQTKGQKSFIGDKKKLDKKKEKFMSA